MAPKKKEYPNGSIYDSNYYGKFKIIEEVDTNNKNRYFKIRFENTGYETVARIDNIRDGIVKDYTYNPRTDYSIGSIHNSNNYGQFKIIERLKETNKNYHTMFRIRFLNTGYEKIVEDTHIRDGRIGDPYARIVYGVACMGIVNEPHEVYKREYHRWNSMISRCYNPNDKRYNTYGGAGIRVCERWLCFENFYYDLPKLHGYDNYIRDPDNYHLDKDILQQGVLDNQKVYSPETCMFVFKRINQFYRSNSGANNNTGYFGVHKSYNKYIASIKNGNRTVIIGVYESPEIAAGAYNCYIYFNLPFLPFNPVRTLTADELVSLNLKTNMKEMCRIIEEDDEV